MALSKDRLISSAPTNFSPAVVDIPHQQLRDLVICPRERGLLCYVQRDKIVEHDITTLGSRPRSLIDLSFTPNTLSSLPDVADNHTLVAAGGQDAEIVIAMIAPYSDPTSTSSWRTRKSRVVWKYDTKLPGSINNSVILCKNDSSIYPRIVVSNNDCTVKMYDVPTYTQTEAPSGLVPSGVLHLPVCVNHSSVSPDGRIIISVGDSSQVYINAISGASQNTFYGIRTLNLPPIPASHASAHLPASFSTAFSSDGTKFAVGSQDGCAVIWDIRSTKPLITYWTKPRKDRETIRSPDAASIYMSGEFRWNYGSDLGPTAVPIIGSPSLPMHMRIYNDPMSGTLAGECKALSSGVRSIKFSNTHLHGQVSGNGTTKEIMVFTEHANMIHIVNMQTLEEMVVEMPIAASSLHPNLNCRTRGSSRSKSPALRHASSSREQIDENRSVPATRFSSTMRRSSTPPSHDVWGSPSPPAGIELYADFTDDDTAERQEAASSLADPECETDDEESQVYTPLLPSETSSSESAMILHASPSSSSLTGPHPHNSRPITSSRLRRPNFGRRYTNTTVPSVRQRSHLSRSTLYADQDLDLDLDLAGLCFDPVRRYMYVASTRSVAEWFIQDSDKLWWSQSDYL